MFLLFIKTLTKLGFLFLIIVYVEPGMSYMVILQIYYNSADLETITNIITTLPVKPEGT